MALIAYLMECKDNYGPHLIIVPNAVMVNWKSELTQWLPSVRCVYYVGHKEERARKFAVEVQSLQFNVLVTTYEYIMRDRSRLSKARTLRRRPCSDGLSNVWRSRLSDCRSGGTRELYGIAQNV